MTAYDLTHTICEEMPLYPDTPGPEFNMLHTVISSGFAECRIALTSHTGTHIDAPAHVFPEGKTLDALDISRFMGSAAFIPCPNQITMEEIAPYREIADKADFLIFHTGRWRLWGTPPYFDFPVPNGDVIAYIIAGGKKGVGIDCMSVDGFAQGIPNHRALLAADCIIVENLCNLDALDGKLAAFYALPLKYRRGDGAPARVAAVL